MDVLAAVVLAVWVYLVAMHGQYWRTSPRLEDIDGPPLWPPVAVIVPARDEAAMLRTTLPTLVAQDYPGPAQVFVVDDQSTDATAAVAASVAVAAAPGAGPLGTGLGVTVVAGEPRPDGWAGKLWAVHQGIARAAQSGDPPPEWLLLTDADIAHDPGSLRRLVAAAYRGRRDLVSVMARLRATSRWERLLIPAFVYFFAQLYPFRRVAGRGSTAAAAGGCVLVRASTLAAGGGIASVRDAVIDDVALARRLKRRGARLWLGFADGVRSVRPYPRLGDIWRMVARSAYTQLRYQPLLVAAVVAGLALVYVAPPAIAIAGLATRHWWVAGGGVLACALMCASYVPTIRFYRLPRRWAMALPAAAVLYGAMTVDSARRHQQGGVEWKGRRYQ